MDIKVLLKKSGLKASGEQELEVLAKDMEKILHILETIPEPHNKSDKHSKVMYLRKDSAHHEVKDTADVEEILANTKHQDNMFKI